MLANFLRMRNAGGITAPQPAPKPVPNPYRAILRRDYPEPFIALLAFLLGIWLWDHYFGKTGGYPPGTEEIALIKIDRDLRLADAMAEDPPWLRKLANVDQPVDVRRDAMTVLQKLEKEKSLSPRGREAFGIIKAEQDGLPMRKTVGAALGGKMISDFEQTSAALAAHDGTWWHAKLIDSWEENARPAAYWRQAYGNDLRQLRLRAVVAGASVWLLGIVGFAFIPASFTAMNPGRSGHRLGYGGAWPVGLGLVVFLVATLAWIGFTMTLELGISALPELHPAVGIFLDSAARLLPPMIALGLLFRRPGHALRVIGLNRPISPKIVLGMFSLLMIVDQVLRRAFDTAGTEPGGGLSLGDAGWWGLAFALMSACLLGPATEEILYRGVLFRSLRNRLGVIAAALVSSIVFAVLHFYDGYGLLSVGVFGFACALIYASRGSLATVIALHMLYNTSIKVPEWVVYHWPLG